MENKKEFSESGTVKSHNSSLGSSPNKSKVNSPAKSMTNSPAKTFASASPARKIPLSDYSPLKGPKSISSFFTPPKPVKTTSSLSVSPQKATSYSSPIMTNPSNLKNAIEDSESDLTVSEGESEKETVEKRIVEEAAVTEDEDDEISFKPASNRGIPFNLNEEEEEEDEVELEADEESGGAESESEPSDISVIISLPSTDSNDQMPVSRRYTDLSNSEYESLISDEEEKEETDNITTLIVEDSDGEEADKIPVMLFNSNQITIQSSPEKKPTSPERRPVMPEKKITPKRPFEEDFIAVKVQSDKPGFPDSENQPPSPKKRSADGSKVSEEVIRAPVTPVIAPQPTVQIPLVQSVSLPSNQPAVQPSMPPMGRFNVPINHVAQPAIRPAPVPLQPAQPVNRDQLYRNVQATTLNVQLPAPVRSKTGYVYDERMLLHFDPHDPEHPEKPARITTIYDKLRAAKLLEKSYRIPLQVKLSEFAPEVQSVHDTKYCRMINQTSLIRNMDELNHVSSQFNSVYINPSTAISATVAATATIELCHSIGRGEIENGFAIVRPPGHHAEHDEAMGFCIYNNVAVAASSLLRKGLARKILILDWDVHHGNGTQNAFAESGDVLYISIHRYDGGKFYPHIEEANCSYVGAGTAGLGK